jgi:hypothetical protein
MIVSLELLQIIGPNLVPKINQFHSFCYFQLISKSCLLILLFFPVVVCINPRIRFGCLIVVLRFKYIISNTLAII